MLIKIMIVVVILACAGPFFIKGPNGDPLMALGDLKPDFVDDPSSLVPPPLKVATPPSTTTVFKWQDDEGTWHFTDQETASTAGAAVETMQLDGIINTMPPPPPPASTAAKPAMKIPAGLTTVAPGQINEMMKTVNSLQETIDARKAAVDNLSKQQ